MVLLKKLEIDSVQCTVAVDRRTDGRTDRKLFPGSSHYYMDDKKISFPELVIVNSTHVLQFPRATVLAIRGCE